MKATNGFQEIIQNYLNQRAAEDELFAVTLKKENKNITDCISYILNTVKASGQMGFADQEVFDMAVHYYDEDDIKIADKTLSAKVVVNHHIDAPPKLAPTVSTPAPAPKQATEAKELIEAARNGDQQAIAKIAEKNYLANKKSAPKKTTANDHKVLSLF